MRAVLLLAWRSLCNRPARTILAATGVVLGVALVVVVAAASGSLKAQAVSALRGQVGEATLMVTPADSGRRLPLGLSPAIEAVEGVARVMPQATGYIGLAVGGGLQYVPVVFLDEAAEAGMRTYRLTEGTGLNGGLALEAGVAAQFGLKVGDRVELLTVRNQRVTVAVTGLLAKEGLLAPGMSSVGLVDARGDLASVWSDLGVVRFLVVPEPGTDPAAVTAALAAALPANAKAGPAEIVVNRGTPGALLMGLSFFSGIAALVGAFLVFGGFSLSLRERQVQTGMTMAVGATRWQVAGALLAEAAGIGLVGSVAGLGTGWLLSFGMVRLAADTLGRPGETVDVSLTAGHAGIALAVGMGMSLLAALLPVLATVRTSPVEAIRRRASSPVNPGFGMAAAGLAIAAASALGWVAATRSGLLIIGQICTATYYIGVIMAVPLIIRWGARYLIEPLARRVGPVAVMAAGNLTRNIARATVTVAAMTVAVAMVISLGSVERSVWAGMEQHLNAVAAGDLVLRGDLSPAVVSRVRALPGVDRAATLAGCRLVTDTGVSFQGAAIEAADFRYIMPFHLAEGNRDRVLQALEQGGAVVLPVHMAREHGIVVGDTLHFHRFDNMDQQLPETVALRVVGLINAVVNNGRQAYIARSDAEAYFNSTVTATLYVKTSADADRVAREVSAAFPRMQVQNFTQFKEMYRRSNAQEVVTFRAILYMALAVSALGIANTLSMSVIAQRRELALLRSVGATASQTWAVVVAEAFWLGLTGVLLGLMAGSLFANSFVVGASGFMNFDLPFAYPVGDAALVAAAGVALALLAALVPAARAGRIPVVEALRAE